MSGHSKWSQIKHQKGATDQRRGQLFTKLGNAIAVTVSGNGGDTDPNSNFRLRVAIEKGRAANMPKINIDRAIERGLGKGGGEGFKEIIYEGFGPGKVAILIQAATDNRQRTNSKLKNLFTENGGVLSGLGTVSYLFKNCGLIKVKKENLTEEKYTEIALENGCYDIEVTSEVVLFYTEVHDLHKIKEKISNRGLTVFDAEIIFRPTTLVKIGDNKTARQILNLVSRLEEEDDVQKVSANFNIPDDLLAS